MQAIRRRYGTWPLALTVLVLFAVLVISDGISPPPVYAATITVNSTADNTTGGDTDCTLREAIINANNDADSTSGDCAAGSGTDTIDFSFSGTISPGSSLPAMAAPVTIDGGGNITLDGSSAATVNGLTITSAGGGSTVKGMLITNWGADGIRITNSSNNTIGGTTPGERNVISANGNDGVEISLGSTFNVVKGNFIGTDAAGTGALGNGSRGVLIVNSSDNTVGGTTAADRNVISANTGQGIRILTSSSTPANNNAVKGNFIGTQVDGTSDLGNGSTGVHIDEGCSSCFATGNEIGGTTSGEGNTIAFNNFFGVRVSGDGATGNPIRGNSIHDNLGAGIDLVSGGNTELGAPTVTSAGSASGTACANCEVDVFSDDADEGHIFHGSVTADGVGNWSFPGAVTGPFVTTTTTDGSGNTSEFSAPFAATLTITVNSTADTTADDGVCTLREAITAANTDTSSGAIGGECAAGSGTDTINFNIAGAGPHTISPGSALPTISQPVTIDGYSQSTASANTNPITQGSNAVLKIELEGSGTGGTALNITGGNTTIKGLVINRFSGTAIYLQTNGNNVIEGNFFGTNVAGTTDLGNSEAVLIDDVGGNTIGGTTAAARNVLSGNDAQGIFIFGSGASGNLVQGNFIGTDAAGSAALGNGADGVVIGFSASNNTIGGTTTAARNVISGNGDIPADNGVEINGSASTGNEVKGNFIGTDAAGTGALGNFSDGVRITNGASNNTIGGTTPGERNVISDNGSDGVDIGSDAATGNVVKGNFIGTDAAGTGDLGNALHGVRISGGASNNTIGAPPAGHRNTIAFNSFDGVGVDGSLTINNPIRGNSIHDNGGLGINNTSGGNTELAPPVVTSAGSAAGTACAGCAVDVYSDAADEGRIFHGAVTADDAGNWSFPGAVTGPFVTATATDGAGTGNTSEFSAPFSGCTDTDGDSLCDSGDPCPANPDCDGDSQGVGDPFGLFLRDGVEVFIGTLVTVACAATPAVNDEDPDALGPDWDDSQDVDGSDLFLFAERFPTEFGVPPPIGRKPYIQRFDIYPTDASLHKIDGSDLFVLASYFGDSCP